MILTSFLIVLIVIFAFQAIRAHSLIASALWLAAASALLALMFYILGALLAAVIELSVGAGLVTVLFAFAIGIAGEDYRALRSNVPKIVSAVLVTAALLIIFWFIRPFEQPVEAIQAPQIAQNISEVIWNQRSLDIMVQIVVIFAGVLGLLGLLAEAKAPLEYPLAEEIAQKRVKELEEMQPQPLDEELERTTV